MEYRTGTLIFSRLSSKRLPNKALLDINGRTLIQRVIDAAKKINSTVCAIATSCRQEDDVFENIARINRISCYRGDLNNVAKRTFDCIKEYKLDYFIRINGDSPILPINLINNAIISIKPTNEIDLITNLYPRTFPYGYSVEIVKAERFKSVYQHFTPNEQEHITSYFYSNIDKLTYINLKNNYQVDNTIRLTIDEVIDYERMKLLFSKYPDICTKQIEEILFNCKYIFGDSN